MSTTLAPPRTAEVARLGRPADDQRWEPAATDRYVAFSPEPVEAAFEDEDNQGRIISRPAVYGVEYRMGGFYMPVFHLLEPGCLGESLASQKSIPIFWAHAWDWTEQAPIGHTVEAVDEAKGPLLTSELYIDSDPTAASVFRAAKAGAIREWSIGYRILEHTVVEDQDNEGRINKKVIKVSKAELWEASLVLRGANPQTETLLVATRKDDPRGTPDDEQAAAAVDLADPTVRRALARLLPDGRGDTPSDQEEDA